MRNISEWGKGKDCDSFRRMNPEFFGGGDMVQSREMVIPSKSTHAQINKPNSKRNDLVHKFAVTWYACMGPKLIEEFKFHPQRKFRSDFCHIETRTCIEIEGGIFNKKGGHSSITGILRDIEKYNEMVYLGFRVIRFHHKSINVPEIGRLIRFLESRKFVA